MQEQIHALLMDEENITWQTLLMELVKAEGMDPWNIDVSQLANSYFKSIKLMKEANLSFSGKLVLASALLLKVKSKRLVDEDITNLDALFSRTEDALYMGDFDENMDLLDPMFEAAFIKPEDPKLKPRTPQPRKRKVSVYDLVDALEKAMTVRKNRVARRLPYVAQNIEMPTGIDVSDLIVSVYGDIKDYFKKEKKSSMKFDTLLKAEDKESKVFTFIPLLHLHNERRIDLSQQETFGDIMIKLLKGRKVS